MKIISTLLLTTMMLAMSSLIFAEKHNNVPDQLGDIFSGKGNTYVGVEVIKDFQLKQSVVGIDKFGFSLWTDCLAGKIDDDVKRDVRGGVRFRIIL